MARSQVPVLVVDDNAAKRLALQAVLAPLGHSIVEAESGEAALRCVMAQDFAVILLDVCMPVMDGFETAALIRLRHQSEMTPIIFITAFASDEIVHTDRYAEGAVDFMFAPIPPDELRAKVSVFANLFIRAEELATRAREVATSADQLRLLTDAAPIGIFRTDADNRYVYTNPRWSELTGVSAEDALGRAWDTIVGTEQRVKLRAELPDGAMSETLCQRFELTHPSSERRIVLVTSKSIPDADGGTAGWVGTLADVTAEAGAEAASANARDKANDASRLKSDFLANMSHEIRTPMNGVIGMTDLLLATDLDAVQRDYAQTVRASGKALLAIIDDILDFSKVEAGKLDIENIEFSVRTIVDDVVDLLAVPAQAKGLELVAVVESSVPSLVGGDPGRVRQVLTNLIGNAIKFTQTGEVVVHVTQSEGDGTDPVLRFEVADSGDGIAHEKLASVFEAFVQADTSTSRKYGGTGLGLAISRQLVTLMGGECGVSSELGSGSTFWFTICVHSGPAKTAEAEPPPDDCSDLVGVAAIVVDDNPAQRKVLAGYLSDWGMIVKTAESGQAALATLRTAAILGQPLSVALVDQSMPGMDGLSLVHAIVADPAITARSVLMTSLGRSDDHAGEPSVVAASLSKPIHRDDLRRCIRRALAGPDEISVAKVTESSPSSGEVEVGRILLAEDNAINQKVTVAMLVGAGYLVDTVTNGAEAVQAAAHCDYDAILMDCQMPELNGYEATAAIRLHEGAGRHTPIIALTAGARSEDKERCLAAGMDHYLAKPVSKDVLLALVARSVTNERTIFPASPAQPTMSGDNETVDAATLNDLRALADASEHEFLDELMNQFVSETDHRLVELRGAMEMGDLPAVGCIARIVRASAGRLGGRRLALSCSRLERKAAAGQGVLGDGRAELREVEFDYEELCRTLTQHLTAAPTRP